MSTPILELSDVSIFQSNQLVLKEVNLALQPGEFVYLIGKTGTGKSSLLKTLYGDLALTQGTGSVAGFQLNGLKEKQIPFLRRNLGIVFQDFQLLSDRSVNDNLRFVLKATGWKNKQQIDHKIAEVLNKVGMGAQGFKMPHTLSGGEQQRVAIARALLNDPPIILADEPTGNLDPQTSKEVLDVLREINQNGKTILMATHDYALLIKFPFKTFKCEDGEVFEVVQKQS